MNKYYRSAVILLFSISLNTDVISNSLYTLHSLEFLKLKFSNSVEFKNSEGSILLNKKEAKKNILALIERINPSDIIPIHEGYSEDKLSYYGIIQLISEKDNYRLFYYCENIDGEYLITKVRFNKR